MEALNPLFSSQIYPYLHQFLLEIGGAKKTGLSSDVLFALVFNLCRRAATDPTPGENLASRYVEGLKQRYGSSREAELVLCLAWVVLMVQERPSYAAATFTQQLQPLIRHASIYSKARQLAVTIRQHERHIQTDFLVTPGDIPIMKVQIDGDHDTGISYTQNTYNIEASSNVSRRKAKALVDTEVVREEILTWVSKVRPLLVDAWKAEYQATWNDILNMQEVKEKVYNPGKQKNTNFNQYLVGNILYFMFEDCGAWSEDKDYNASEVCMKLIGTTEHQLRKELAKFPPEEIKNRLHDYFTKKFQL